jgi:hypothetical protein
VKTTQFGDVPNSWGESELTRFVDFERQNQIATLLHNKDGLSALEQVDAVLHEFVANISHIPNQQLAPILALRCHSAFRAASSLALAGHAAETFVLIRSLLEYAGYGLLISRDDTLGDLWVSRHQDKDAPKKIAKAFNPTTIREALKKISPEEADRFDLFYQRSIDFGAHPNAHAVNSGMEIREEDREFVFTILYLHANDKPQRHALKSLAQAALCALNVFAIAFPERANGLRLTQKVATIAAKFPL